MRKNKPIPIIIDTQEQKPFFYDKQNHPDFPNIEIEFEKLKTGDYSIRGMSDPFLCFYSTTIERKSPEDLFGSLSDKTGRRTRLQNEFFRMSQFTFSAIVTEIDIKDIYYNPPQMSGMRPQSVYGTLLSWCMRYNVQWYPCPNRIFAEKTTYLLLKKFWDDRQGKGKMVI